MAEYDNSIFKLFGFELKRAEDKQKEEKKKKLQSIVAPTDPDGAGYITASGSHYGQYLDMDGTQAKDNRQLILKYRGVAVHPEVDAAIEDIVNEGFVNDENQSPVELNLDNVDAPDNIKKTMIEEFEKVCNCDLQFIGIDSSIGILGRLKLEADETNADIILGLDTNLLTAAKNTKLLAKHNIDTSKIDLPIKWNDEIFVPFDWGHFAFIYNSEKLKSPPTSFEELSDDKNSLSLIIQDPRTSTPGLGLLLWVKSIFKENSDKIWERLSPKIVTVTKGWSEAYGLFLEGEADLVLSYTTSPAYHIMAEEDKKYKAAIFNEGHYLQVEVAAITTKGEKNKLSRDFMKFILSENFQSVIPTTNWMFPVTDIKVPETFENIPKPEKVLLMDSSIIEKNRKKWISEWRRASMK